MEKTKVKFYGIDGWNRPVFKSISGDEFFGALDILFDYGAGPEEVKGIKAEDLSYFGRSFNCEPMGSQANIEIVREA